MNDSTSSHAGKAETAYAEGGFHKLPVELLLRIAYLLDTPALGHLRRTCRFVKEVLEESFVEEFFTQKQFMITQFSLQTLVELSESRLGRRLRCLHISLEQFKLGLFSSAPDQANFRRLSQMACDDRQFWATGHYCTMLTEAFKHLKELQDIVISDCGSGRRRTRDSPHGYWLSYGHNTFLEETGSFVSWETNDTEFIAKVFGIVLCALGAANARPAGIEIISKNGAALADYAFNIPSINEASILPVLNNLKKLHLAIRSGQGYEVPYPTLSTPARDINLCRFLSFTPNLTDLRLDVHKGPIKGFEKWLVDQDFARVNGYPWPPPPWHLESLSLGYGLFDQRRLLDLVRLYASSLKSLNLWAFFPENPVPHKPAPWVGWLNELSQIPDLDLRHVKIGEGDQSIEEEEQGVQSPFCFVREYKGPDWKQFIRETMACIENDYISELNKDTGEVGLDEEAG